MRYLKSKKLKSGPADITVYFRCNRDVVFQKESISTSKRAIKQALKDGLSQIAQNCTASLIKTNIGGSHIFVNAYPTHANHPIDDRHMYVCMYVVCK